MSQKANGTTSQFEQHSHPSAWFEEVYTKANWDGAAVPWANLAPRPDLVEWLNRGQVEGQGKKALVIGCGLGDDAEELAQRGFAVTAFDISETAITWCQKRFPNSRVNYQVADLFNSPPGWHKAFDFVLEYYTIQALPPEICRQTMQAVARHVAPRGTLLVICLGRDADLFVEGPPWPLSKEMLDIFRELGLIEVDFEEYNIRADALIRTFRVQYHCCNQLV